MSIGQDMYGWAQDLFPIARSITGPGVRETISYIQGLLPDLTLHEIASGTPVFDWTVPDEWAVREAHITDESGERIVDFKVNNLHLVGYSESVDQWFELAELNKHLYSLPEQPTAIPYITSYYERRWGFCLTHNQRESLRLGRYRAVVDSDLKPGVLNYGELILPGETDEEVFLSTYVCHPSMANNEISGPVVTTALAQWLMSAKKRRYTYRIIFIPETIGSIVYLSRYLSHLKKHVIAGFNISCVGDERAYSYLPSRAGDTLSDKAALHVLKYVSPEFKRYTWLERGSDERQYCSPGVDLPIATIMRSKYGEYPEYHTSLDDLQLVTPNGLEGGYHSLRRAIEIIENNACFKTTSFCEPQLGKRGLYPTLSTKDSGAQVERMMNLISYCDGDLSLLDIADLVDVPFWELAPVANELLGNGLFERR